MPYPNYPWTDLLARALVRLIVRGTEKTIDEQKKTKPIKDHRWLFILIYLCYIIVFVLMMFWLTDLANNVIPRDLIAQSGIVINWDSLLFRSRLPYGFNITFIFVIILLITVPSLLLRSILKIFPELYIYINAANLALVLEKWKGKDLRKVSTLEKYANSYDLNKVWNNTIKIYFRSWLISALIVALTWIISINTYDHMTNQAITYKSIQTLFREEKIMLSEIQEIDLMYKNKNPLITLKITWNQIFEIDPLWLKQLQPDAYKKFFLAISVNNPQVKMVNERTPDFFKCIQESNINSCGYTRSE